VDWLSRIRPYAPTALLALLIFYFGVNAVTGERGLASDRRRVTTLASRNAELKRLRLERAELETRVRLLGDASLSADLLQERAQAVLGYADPRDYVVRLQP
jgi:cell division protein FtsB